MAVKTVYRGSDSGFGLSIKQSRFNALYFTADYDFASRFGNVSRYKLRPKRILNLTIDVFRAKVFKQISVGVTSAKNLETIYSSGDFWMQHADDSGFSFKLLKLIIDYAQKNEYDVIKMREYFSQKITPIIYVVVDELIVSPL